MSVTLCLKFDETPIYIASDLSLFTHNPEHFANISIISRARDRECRSLRNKVVSSTYWLIFYDTPPIVIPSILGFFLIACARVSTTKMKSRAESGQPCLIPLVGLKNWLLCPLLLTHVSMLLYKVFIAVSNGFVGPSKMHYKIFI